MGFPYKYQIVYYYKEWQVVLRIRKGKKTHSQMLQILTPLRYFTEFGYFPDLQRAVLSYNTIKNPNLSIIDRLIFMCRRTYKTGHSLDIGEITWERFKEYTHIKTISRTAVNRTVHKTYKFKKRRIEPLSDDLLELLKEYKYHTL